MAAENVQHAAAAVEQIAATADHHDVSTGVTLFFTGILMAMIATLALEEKLHAKKSLIVGVFGANLGGNLTPIGSASTLVAVTIIHKYKLPMSFAGFVKMALPYAAVQIVLATACVLIFLR